MRTTLLEIDTGDDIHLFSQYDLGEPVVPVAETLMQDASVTPWSKSPHV